MLSTDNNARNGRIFDLDPGSPGGGPHHSAPIATYGSPGGVRLDSKVDECEVIVGVQGQKALCGAACLSLTSSAIK